MMAESYRFMLERPSWYIFVGLLIVGGLSWLVRKDELVRLPIPRYGGSLPFSRAYHALKLLKTGPLPYFQAYRDSPLVLLPRIDRWMVLVDSTLLHDLQKAPSSILSLTAAVNETFHLVHSLGYKVATDHWHVAVIKNELTRQLGRLFGILYEELQLTIAEKLGREKLDENGWRRVKAVPFFQSVVARVSNRLFVGIPLCRNEQWIKLNEDILLSVIITAMILNLFPVSLQPIVGYLISPEKRNNRKVSKVIGSLVEERLSMDDEDRPNDLITWLIRIAPETEKNTEDIAKRVIAINFVALHTTSMTSVQALYWLLAKPEYIQPLREEVLEVTAELGWTKEAISQMHKLDSFLAESSRMTPLGAEVTQRVSLQPFTFSNGTTIPKGTLVTGNMWAVHRNPTNYDHPTEFDAQRWLKEDEKMNKKEGKRDGKEAPNGHIHVGKGHASKMVTVSKTYLPFGVGKSACPGRFFAATQLKALLAHLIVDYEIEWAMDPEGKPRPYGWRPEDVWYGTNCTPNPDAEILIRKRHGYGST